jgi:hypothetical protein
VAKFVITDIFGTTVVGTLAAWDHVLDGHPEMSDKEDLVKEAIINPTCVHQSTKDPARRLFRGATISSGFFKGSYAVAVVRYGKNGVGFLLTAYLKTLPLRGPKIWP